MQDQMMYLDNNATTKMASEVLDAMKPYFSESYGNPSSLYDFGTQVRRVIEEVRKEAACCLDAKSEREIVFTSGGTESNHTAIHSALEIFPNRKRIVTTQVEHSSIRNLCQMLQKKGYEVIIVGVSKAGALDCGALKEALTDHTAIVSIMWANNETGVLFPIEQLATWVKNKGVLFHVDAIQAVGKIPVSLKNVPINYLSFSAHKFHGPKGIGGLYVREGTPFSSLFVGGRQERDRRAGTEHVSGIVGMAKALSLAQKEMISKKMQIENLRNYLEKKLLELIPDSFVNGKNEPRLPNTTNVTVPGIDSETLLIRLSEGGICASSGSACLTGALEPSHVLQAMGHSRELALSSIRLSLSRYTTKEEIDRAIEMIANLANELRELNRTQG
jgi:cysteine desulfurase